MKTIVIIGLLLASCGREPAGDVKLARAVKAGDKVSRGIKAIIDKKLTKMKAVKADGGDILDQMPHGTPAVSIIGEKEIDSIQSVVDSILKESSGEIGKVIDDVLSKKTMTVEEAIAQAKASKDYLTADLLSGR